MINCGYSINEIYHKYKNGMPISEIVKITGIKRKTWNKRFERLEKEKMAAINNKNSNYSELIIPKKDKNNYGDNFDIIDNKVGDNGDKLPENVSTTNTFDLKGETCGVKNDKVDSLALLSIELLIIGLILLFKWIYDNYNNWKFLKNRE